MSWLKTLWGLLFRLFPAPTPTGLQRIGDPGRDSPVLVTCNFDLTVKRLRRALRGHDLWLLVADSRGVNVWCAAGAGEFSTRSVVSAVKTSGVGERVDHRTLILPVLGAPGIRASDVEAETGWTVEWGPVQMGDIPRHLSGERDPALRRATYGLAERLDTALGSMFAFFLAGLAGFAIFGRGLLVDYVVVSVVTFLLFYTLVPWIPTKAGWTKALVLDLLLGGVLVATELLLDSPAPRPRADLIIAMSMVMVWGSELGGLSSTMASDFDPMMARMGIKSLGNVAFAGALRTDLLNGFRVLTHEPRRCTACGQCVAVCPLGVWASGADGIAILKSPRSCTGCTACLRQCTDGAIRAPKAEG